MSRIANTFATLKAAQRIALIPYVVVGQPSLAATPALVSALIEAGADLVELGVPFSDPLADGPVIQRATHHALLQGVTPRDCLAAARQVRARQPHTPLLFMGYYNPILRFGVDAYARACAEAGVDGLIVPDLPLEESGELETACRAHAIDLIFLLAPTSDESRVAAVARRASGFIYCVSVVGVTGARHALSDEVEALVTVIRRHSDLPVAIGFGISQPEHVQQVARFADGAVVGSALVDVIARAPAGHEAAAAAAYWQTLTAA
ncbi:MAG: tryptophan synthase subunit alpha [Chloroflexi bacterium]|nr:tryptophan synthase subunit alpha [Chloroflexota bacterium]